MCSSGFILAGGCRIFRSELPSKNKAMHFSFPPQAGEESDPDVERRALIGLSLVPGVGGGRIRALLARFGTPSAVWRAPRSALLGVPGIGEQTAEALLTFDASGRVDAQIERAEQVGAELLPSWDDRFPRRLRQIYDPPAFLWATGTWRSEDERAVAVVGTRRCTDYGRAQARRLTRGLVRHGFTIVSGLAYGIDAVAHRTALEEGGRTVAVLGSGLARIYPAAHTRLARRAARQGVVFSEFALDADPDAPHFPERNRIVSGLTLGTLVVESRGEGGALITARMACEQNREVFAVPGDAGRPTSEGTNRLIQRSHAKLVLTVEDILEEFGAGGGRSLPAGDAGGASGSSPDASPADLPPLAGPARRLYDHLSADDPVHLDALCERTDVAPSTALAVLFDLELQGRVRQLAGKRFCRA